MKHNITIKGDNTKYYYCVTCKKPVNPGHGEIEERKKEVSRIEYNDDPVFDVDKDDCEIHVIAGGTKSLDFRFIATEERKKKLEEEIEKSLKVFEELTIGSKRGIVQKTDRNHFARLMVEIAIDTLLPKE